jgi:hypothetical protein
MESVYHIVAIRVNETSWTHVWRLHFRYLGTGYDKVAPVTSEGGRRAVPTLDLGFQDLISGMAPLGTMATVEVAGTRIDGARVLEVTSANQIFALGMAISARWQHHSRPWVSICMGKEVSKGVQHRVTKTLKRGTSVLSRGLKVRHNQLVVRVVQRDQWTRVLSRPIW